MPMSHAATRAMISSFSGSSSSITGLLTWHRPEGPPARAARDSGNLTRVLEATLKRPGATLSTLLNHDLEDL
ncbi:hypothetical protein [Actinomycetospora cinnamomea]|uniref:hypothetical protein n=1 Tax=Actinomycetospora cinnamomea TaxID=663609 RepID=UPI0014025B0C|nr:hypothetical protein [Actinomycetospora cinnamomea]